MTVLYYVQYPDVQLVLGFSPGLETGPGAITGISNGKISAGWSGTGF